MPKDPMIGEAGRLALTIGGEIAWPAGGGIIGAIIGGFLFPPTQPYTPLQSFKLTTGRKGQPLKVLWGCNRITGDYIWYGDFQIIPPGGGKKGGGGKGGKATTPNVTTYTVGLGLDLCEGADPDSIVRQKIVLKKIYSGKDVIWADDGSVGSGVNFSFYDGAPGQMPDPYMAQFTGSAAMSSVLSSDIGPVDRETFSASGTGPITYYVNNPPIATGTVQVWYNFTDPNTGYAIQVYLTPTTANPPTGTAEFFVNDANGYIVLGSAPPLFEGDNSHDWNGTTIFVQYQQAQGVIVSSIGALAYPHQANIVLPAFHLGNTTAAPNFTFEVCVSGGAAEFAAGRDQLKSMLFAGPGGDLQSFGIPTDDSSSSTEGVLVTPGNVYSLTTYQDNIAYLKKAADLPPTSWANMSSVSGSSIGPEHVVGSKLLQAADGSFLINATRQVRFSGDGHLYIARSPDGVTWSPVLVDNISVPGFSEVDLAVDNIERLSTGTLLLLVRYYGFYPATEYAYIYRSADNGLHWTQVFTYGPLGLFQMYNIDALQVVGQGSLTPNAYLLLSGTVDDYGFVWRSADDGQTWQFLSTGGFIPGGGGGIYPIAKRDSWEKFGDFPSFIWKINPNPNAPNGALMMSWNTVTGPQISIYSTDNGATWGNQASFPAAWKYIDDAMSTPVALYGWVQLNSEPNGQLHLYKSVDNANTWTDTGQTAGVGGATLMGPLWWSVSLGSTESTTDCNPVDCVYDFLLNARFGLGEIISVQDIDHASYQATREYVASQGIFVSPVLDTLQSGLRCLEELLLYYDGWLLFSQGLVKFGVRKPDVAQHTFNLIDNVWGSLPSVTRSAPKDTKNRIVIEWSNRENNYNQSFVKLDNDQDIIDTGERIQQYQMKGVTTAKVAAILVARAFASLSVRKLSLAHAIDPKWGLVEAGDTYNGYFPGIDVTDKAFRIQQIKEDAQWGLTLEAVEDPLLLAPTVPAAAQGPPPVGFFVSGMDVTDDIALTSPDGTTATLVSWPHSSAGHLSTGVWTDGTFIVLLDVGGSQVTSGDDQLVQSTDDGLTWTAINTDLPPVATGNHFPSVVKIPGGSSATDTYILGSTSNYFDVSHDGGHTFVKKFLSGRVPPYGTNYGYSMVVRKTSTGAVLGLVQSGVGTGNGGRFEVWRSADKGDTWSLVFTAPLTVPISGYDQYGGGLQVLGNVIMVRACYQPIPGTTADRTQFYRSIDDGQTWHTVLDEQRSSSLQPFVGVSPNFIGIVPGTNTWQTIIGNVSDSQWGASPVMVRWSSVDNGATWGPDSYTVPTAWNSVGGWGWTSTNMFLWVDVPSSNENQFKLITSSDGGNTWADVPTVNTPSGAVLQYTFDGMEDTSVPAPVTTTGAAVLPTFGIQPAAGGATSPTTVPPAPTIGYIVEVPQEISGTQGPALMAYGSASGTGWFGSSVSISRDGGVTYSVVGTIGPAVSGVLTTPMYVSDVYAPDQQVQVDMAQSNGQLVSNSPASFFQWQSPMVVGVTPSATTPVAANQNYEGTEYLTAQLISGHRYMLTTFQRGIFHTTPQTWPAGTNVVMMNEVGLRIPITVSDVGKTLYFKFVSESRFGTQVVSAAPTYLTYTPVGLGLIPAPVSQLQIVRPDGVHMAQMTAF